MQIISFGSVDEYICVCKEKAIDSLKRFRVVVMDWFEKYQKYKTKTKLARSLTEHYKWVPL